MDNKITDINDLVDFLTGIAMQPITKDEMWQNYGYKKLPRRGNIWNRLFPKIFELENLITRELLTMGLVDTLNGIKRSSISPENKLWLSIGIIDRTLPTISHLFNSRVFIENLISSYASYSSCEKSKAHEAFILKAKDILTKKDFAKYMVGTIRLLGTHSCAENLLINSEKIKNVIENAKIENRLKIGLSEDNIQEYTKILSEKILNT
jgi:hypothetical protein